MDFKDLSKVLQENLERISKDQQYLYTVDLDKDELWNLYLDSFPEGTNPIFRENRKYDCSCCRQFIKSFGNVVAINDLKIKTIWETEQLSDEFNVVFEAIDNFVKAKPIQNVLVTKFKKFGTAMTPETLEDGTVINWKHFNITLPEQFCMKSKIRLKTEGSILSDFNANKSTLRSSFDKISDEALSTVEELIKENTLYKGAEWSSTLSVFRKARRDFYTTPSKLQDNYCWVKSTELGSVVSKIKNHSIGVLLQDITEDMDLEQAVKRYENIVAPTNYKRPKAIFSKKMLEQAKDKLAELGLLNSLGRRYATVDDLTVNNVIFKSRPSTVGESEDPFDMLSKDVTESVKKFSRSEKVSMDQLITDIIPKAKTVEVLVENRHESNMVSLIAPEDKESKSLFKWNNGYSWSYKGNITDSLMKERVKMAGGKVDGVLRFSIQWNDGSDYNNNDFDAHSKEPNNNTIYYQNKRIVHPSSGMLDVDIINPIRNKPAVENIIYSDLSKMPIGTYKFRVHTYSDNGGTDGFSAEIEFDGNIYSYSYPHRTRNNEFIDIAEVTLSKDRIFSIKHLLDHSKSSKDIWNLSTNKFHNVHTVCLSPNYWESEKGTGNKHYMFFLDNCINEDNSNGFYNEFLRQDLNDHRKVFEALGNKMKAKYSDNQLSGLGFSSTQKKKFICRIDGKKTYTVE
jgi:hypothetical protein